MRVYVETNFVLELIRGQEQAEPCQRLLEHATDGQIEVAIPAFCLSEPYVSIRQRRIDSDALIRLLARTGFEVARSSSRVETRQSLKVAETALRKTLDDEQMLHRDVVREILATAEIILLGRQVLEAVADDPQGLSFPDSVVFHSVLTDLRDRPTASAVFLTRDRKDFSTPDIRRELKKGGCDLIPSFADGLKRTGQDG